MLLLQPWVVMLSFLTPRWEGSVSRGVTRMRPAGARVAMATLDLLLSRPFVQHVRMVSRRCAVVMLLGQQLR